MSLEMSSGSISDEWRVARTVNLKIPGEPYPWRPARAMVERDAAGRPIMVYDSCGRCHPKIRHFKEKSELQWKDHVQAVVKAANPPYWPEGVLSIWMRAIYLRPKGFPKTKKLDRQPKTTKPDFDNLLKGMKDALEGIVCANDAQFFRGGGEVLWGRPGEPCHVELRIEYWERIKEGKDIFVPMRDVDEYDKTVVGEKDPWMEGRGRRPRDYSLRDLLQATCGAHASRCIRNRRRERTRNRRRERTRRKSDAFEKSEIQNDEGRGAPGLSREQGG